MGRPRRVKLHGETPTRDVNAATRVLAALQLRREGHGWAVVAAQSGYAGPGPAHRAVQRELNRQIIVNVEDYRREQLDQLDQLQTVYWPKAMSGDGWSFDRVLRLMERRAALLGLDAPKPSDANTIAAAQVIIREYPVGVADAV